MDKTTFTRDSARHRNTSMPSPAMPRMAQLDPAMWDQFVQEKWPAYRDYLPKQAEIMAMLHTSAVFLGAFYPHE